MRAEVSGQGTQSGQRGNSSTARKKTENSPCVSPEKSLGGCSEAGGLLTATLRQRSQRPQTTGQRSGSPALGLGSGQATENQQASLGSALLKVYHRTRRLQICFFTSSLRPQGMETPSRVLKPKASSAHSRYKYSQELFQEVPIAITNLLPRHANRVEKTKKKKARSTKTPHIRTPNLTGKRLRRSPSATKEIPAPLGEPFGSPNNKTPANHGGAAVYNYKLISVTIFLLRRGTLLGSFKKSPKCQRKQALAAPPVGPTATTSSCVRAPAAGKPRPTP